MLEVLASIPCINSLKMADTILRELRGRGLMIVEEPPDMPMIFFREASYGGCGDE